MHKSVSKRIKVKKSGKILHRATTLGHSRANKNSIQMQRKKIQRDLDIHVKKVKTYF
ncbi:MAG: hypothetical protein ABSF47_00805 [Minisyncoccia bacterium]|jgi:ribosomal protein L35